MLNVVKITTNDTDYTCKIFSILLICTTENHYFKIEINYQVVYNAVAFQQIINQIKVFAIISTLLHY